MIARLVKLSFDAAYADEFDVMFHSVKNVIKKFAGCHDLYLLKDINNPSTFFTYSVWENESDLDFYRNSEVFKSYWTKIKPHFKMKAEAWTLETS
jgi:autoinducer 2-degrading protein